MKTLAAVILSATLAAGVAWADPAPIAPARVVEHRRTLASQWWIWTAVALLAAGTITTTAVIATRDSWDPPAKEIAVPVALTVRF